MGSLAEALVKAEQEQQTALLDSAVEGPEAPSVDEVPAGSMSDRSDVAAESPDSPAAPPEADAVRPSVADEAQTTVDTVTAAGPPDELARVITDIESQLSGEPLTADAASIPDTGPVEPDASHVATELPPTDVESVSEEEVNIASDAESAEADTTEETIVESASAAEEEEPVEPTAVEPEPMEEPLPAAESLISVPTYEGPTHRVTEEDAPVAEIESPPPDVGLHQPIAEPAWELVQDQELAEQYRGIRRELMSRLPRDRSLVVAIVGVAEPGADDASGTLNSVAALNLGSVIAEIKGTNAVVIDADFASHCITDLLRLQDAPGLADVAVGGEQIGNVIQNELVGHVDIVPAGDASGKGPVELLGSDRCGMAFSALRERYDVVLVDVATCPGPTLIDHFPALFTGVLLVTGTTKVDEQRAKVLVSRFEERGVSVIGCILATSDEG